MSLLEIGVLPPQTGSGMSAQESLQGERKESDFTVQAVSTTAGQSAGARDVSQTLKSIDELASQHDVEIHFHYDPKVHRVWLDFVDKTTGKVINEIPPEAVRRLIESLGSTSGWLVDKRS
ncbi:flagellar protein FlaG [Alicyclobacillus macrosporangiidus]|uniref:flagellar protein FlaG n=1 Tax=Alicyclobacillus macrosporangiidus TaxID=392015 RepID=UPI0004972971|nr:flagellar protein FlaG [Alicyclobacillus macrosporangiidus]